MEDLIENEKLIVSLKSKRIVDNPELTDVQKTHLWCYNWTGSLKINHETKKRVEEQLEHHKLGGEKNQMRIDHYQYLLDHYDEFVRYCKFKNIEIME